MVTVVSYYTKNSLYEKEVEDLKKSLEDLKIDFEIDGIEDLGSWQKNCFYKPQFLLEKLEKFKKPILWIDADAVVVKPLKYFETVKEDIAIRKVKGNVLTGTIFSNYNKRVVKLLESWKKRCDKEKRKDILEQQCLDEVLKEEFFNNNIKIKELDPIYCFIFSEKLKKGKIVICHFQASRFKGENFKNLFLKDVSFLKNLSSLELKLLRCK